VKRCSRAVRLALLAIGLLSIPISGAAAPARHKDEIPPATAKPLSEIIRIVEGEGHTVITDVDFDDWQWIIRSYKSGFEYILRVDPVTGKILSISPD